MADRVRLPRLLQKALQSDGNTLKEKARLHPLSLSVELNLYPLSRATMTLPETDAAVQMHDLVEIFGQNGSFGIFRVVNIATTYKRQRQVQLNHALDVFSDALLPGEMTATGTVAQVLAQFVAGQTANIGGSPYWALGTCEDTNAYSADIKYTNLMQCLTNLAKAEEDYYFTFDFSRFPWRLNFIARNDTVLSEFRLPRNVESCQVSFDNSDMCTRLYLSVDTTTTSQDGSTTVTTHETHNDTAAQALYGIVSKTAGIKAEQVPDKAAWVQRYFARHAQPGVQISISGREINRLSGETLDEMHLGRICRVALPEYSTTFNERIIAVKYPDVLRDPERVDVSLANKKQSAEGSFAGLTSRTSATESASKETQKELQNTKTSTTTKWRVTDQHVTDQGTILHEAGLEIDAHGVWLFAKEQGALGTMQAGLNVAADNIAAEVSRATAAEGTMSAQLSVQAGQISSKVSQTDYNGNTIASLINQTATTILIQAAHINLDGYVTANQFDALSASFNNLISGNLAASKITATAGNFSNLEITNSLVYGGYGDLKGKIINALSSSASGGTITISSTTLDGSAGPSVNFNIADTQFYKNAVASAKREGVQSVRILADDITLNGNPTYYSYSKQYSVPVYAEATNGKSNTNGIMINASEAWSAGWSDADAQYSVYSQYTPYRVTDRTYQSYTLYYKVASNVYQEAGSNFVKVSQISTTLYEKSSS